VAQLAETPTYKPEDRGFDSRSETFVHEFCHSALRAPNKTENDKHYDQMANLENRFLLLECKLASTRN
jgi:hypothetical protein